jgi:hypothetical protein
MSGLTNKYVEELGKKIIGKQFLGTFPCDIHPNPGRKAKFSLIFNLSKHDTKGTHFIAIFANSKYLMYFDPLAHECDNKDILFFLNNIKGKRIIKTKFRKIQSCESIFCGFFCIAFLLANHKNISLPIFFKQFKRTDLDKNDSIVTDFIMNNI